MMILKKILLINMNLVCTFISDGVEVHELQRKKWKSAMEEYALQINHHRANVILYCGIRK